MASLSVSGCAIMPLCMLPQEELTPIAAGLENYPEINLNREMLNVSSMSLDATHKFSDSCILNSTWRNVLVPVSEGASKRIIRTFFEAGFVEAINEARAALATDTYPILSTMAEYTFQVCEFLAQLKSKIFPHAKEHGNIGLRTETRDWSSSFIRCIIWHPNRFIVAVAGADDVIRIYTDQPAIVPVLKGMEQKWITSMAWRPYAAAELAVGCQKGICLWTMDGNMHITRTASQAVFLAHPDHSAITSVDWNRDGTLLATASFGDSNILIWDVDKQQNVALKRVGPPCSLLKWSPDGLSLFSATVSNVFRLWFADKWWQPERWTIRPGYTIRSACWSPCSSFLIFATSNDSLLYALKFYEDELFQYDAMSKEAMPIANVMKCSVGHRVIGGYPQALAWDPKGVLLAVIFNDSPCVVIFSTCIQKFTLTCSPAGFLAGINGETPSCICFQSNHRRNTHTVLTIGWSSGRVQYHPFYMQ